MMFLPEMHSWRQTNNSLLEGTLRLVEKHDRSQCMYPAVIGENCECGSSIFHSSFPSSYCVHQSQNALVDDNIYEGDCGPSAYANPLNSGNVMSNSFAIPHEINCGETENNSTELNPGAFCNDWNLRKQEETSGFNPDEGRQTFLCNQDFLGEKVDIFTVQNREVHRKSTKPEMAADIPAGRTEHIGFRINRTARDLKGSGIDRASGSKDRHTKVLTSKGPRDRRIRLSVGTAVKLFCVQERLGFDQPSKAVEWLIENSQAAVRELIQLSSLSSSHNSQYADSNRAAVSLSCHRTGDPGNSPQENIRTASGDCLLNLYKEILEAENCAGQKSSTATTTESNNRDSIVPGGKIEPRSMAISSVASSRIPRERANAVRRKEFRAKARERARERMKQKEQRNNQHGGMYGTLQRSSVHPQYPKFCLQDNTTSVSSLNIMNETIDGNMMDETIDGNGYSNAFLHSLMFPKGSIMCSHSRSLPNVDFSAAQQEGISIQSTALSGLDPETFPLCSDPFHQAVATTNNSIAHETFCRSPLNHSHLISSNLYGSCTEGIPGAYDSGLETLYESQSSLNSEIFKQFQVYEEISGLPPSNDCVPLRRVLTNPSAYIGISCLL